MQGSISNRNIKNVPLWFTFPKIRRIRRFWRRRPRTAGTGTMKTFTAHRHVLFPLLVVAVVVCFIKSMLFFTGSEVKMYQDVKRTCRFIFASPRSRCGLLKVPIFTHAPNVLFVSL